MCNKVLAVDIGSSNIKVCIYERKEEILLISNSTCEIGLYSDGFLQFENDPEEIWLKLCETIKKVIEDAKISNEDIGCISICSQAQCLIMVDKNGKALTPVYNSQDGRAVKEYYKYYASGFKICGLNAVKVIKCIMDAGITPASAKDPVFKYKWVQENLKDYNIPQKVDKQSCKSLKNGHSKM